MTFLNLTFVKIMPSIYRLGAYAVNVGFSNFAAGEGCINICIVGRYYCARIACISAQNIMRIFRILMLIESSSCRMAPSKILVDELIRESESGVKQMKSAHSRITLIMSNPSE